MNTTDTTAAVRDRLGPTAARYDLRGLTEALDDDHPVDDREFAAVAADHVITLRWTCNHITVPGIEATVTEYQLCAATAATAAPIAHEMLNALAVDVSDPTVFRAAEHRMRSQLSLPTTTAVADAPR